MNWNAIGAIGEIVGALAVVASLLYLASQIRAQNREARMASVHQVIEGYRSSIAALHDPEMADIFVTALDGFDHLTPSQRLRFIVYCTSTLRACEDAYFQRLHNRLDVDTWETLMAPLVDFKSTDGCQKFWAIRRHHFREDFADYFDSLEPGAYSLSTSTGD